jgi:GT2 family glycosyltransferase
VIWVASPSADRSRPTLPPMTLESPQSADKRAATIPDCTVVVVTWRGAEHIRPCLDSLLHQTADCNILVIDNASDDGTEDILYEYSQEHHNITVVRSTSNLGFAGGVELALHHVGSPFVALLNDAAEADSQWLYRLRTALDDRPFAAAATSKILLRSDGRLNNAGVALTRTGYGFDVGYGDDPAEHDEARTVFGFCGGAALLRADAVRACGGFPGVFFLYYEDTDTSWRLRLNGWSIVYEPSAVVHHRHGATANHQSALFAYYNERNRLWMLARCAPGPVALHACIRFAMTTVSLLAKSIVRRRPTAAHFSPMLRCSVLATTVWNLPRLLRQRHGIATPRGLRKALWGHWAGTPARH